jgi:hypothetical protein
MKIIPQAFHRVQDHQNRNPEWKVMAKVRCAENRAYDDPTVPFLWAPDEHLRRRKQVYKHRMIWWYHRMIASVHIMLFSRNIQRSIRVEIASTRWTDAIIGSSYARKMLKCSGFLHNLVENFIIFPTSTRSSKTEFGAEIYGQNTEGQRRGWQDEPLVP